VTVPESDCNCVPDEGSTVSAAECLAMEPLGETRCEEYKEGGQCVWDCDDGSAEGSESADPGNVFTDSKGPSKPGKPGVFTVDKPGPGKPGARFGDKVRDMSVRYGAKNYAKARRSHVNLRFARK